MMEENNSTQNSFNEINKTNNETKMSFKNYIKLYKLGTRDIATNGVIAALYTALTYAFFFMSYGPIQFRISEFLVLLVFFNPNYIYGLTLGCVLTNIYSAITMTPLDLVFGVLATFLSCLIIPLCKHLAIASILPAIFNGFLLAIEFSIIGNNFSSVFFFTNVGTVALGEIVCVTIIGLIFIYGFTKFKSYKNIFHQLVNTKINLDYKW